MLSTHPQGGVKAVFITSPKGAVFEAPWAALILKVWEGTPARDNCVFGVLIHRLPILMTNPASHVTSDGGERTDLERVCGRHLKPTTLLPSPTGIFPKYCEASPPFSYPLLPALAAELKSSFDFVAYSLARTEAVGPGG